MKNYAVRITGKRTEYSEYNITIQANSLAEAKKKAAEIALRFDRPSSYRR